MLVLGLLLIIGAALITVGAIFDAGESATVEILGQTLSTTAAGVFVAGAVTMLMFLVGVWAVSASFGRARRKRAERKAAKQEHKQSLARLEEERVALREENERLARELAERRAARTAPDTARTAPDTTAHTDTDTSPTTPVMGAAPSEPSTDRPDKGHTSSYSGERVIDHRTDLTSLEPSTSADGRHRERM